MEGVEVPIISAQIQIVADSPAAATLQIIATDKALEFLPRTLVHLFFFDFVDATSPLTTADNSTPENFNYDQYKLLFAGEVQGISFAKEPGNRSIILSCVDLSNYWDTTYQYNFNGQLLGGRKEAQFIGANANLLNGVLGHGVGLISRLLSQHSVNFPHLTGLLGGIVHVLEAVGGCYYGEKAFSGANPFTSIAELRLKILQQIWAAEMDSSTKKLFTRKTFNMWMNREIGGLDKLVTFRGLVQLMQRFIYHEVYPNPAPLYVPGRKNLKEKKTTVTDVSQDPRTAKFWQEIQSIEAARKQAQSNLSQIRETQGSSGAIPDLQANLFYMSTSLHTVAVTLPTVPGLNLLKDVSIMRDALTKVRKWLCNDTNGMVIDPAKIGNPSSIGEADKELNRMFDAYTDIMRSQIKQERWVTFDERDRLNNQLFRPDIWFGAAPRCNVLFPELYSQFQWSRNFLREVTRLELQMTHEILGDDALFNLRNYAPNVIDMRKGVKLSSRKFNGLIMKHELLTGIIPMYEKMTQANLFAMKSGDVNVGGARVSYAQRAVNHQYFKHRFASRQMSATGRFNPWFVAGFPGIILDRPMATDDLAVSSLPIDEMIDAIASRPGNNFLDSSPTSGVQMSKARMLQYLVGPQYTGVCVQLAHSVTQQGGSTSYGFAQARVHRESVEFLGVDKVQLSRKTGKPSHPKTVVAALPEQAPKEGGRGPRGGIITGVVDVTKSFLGKKLHLWPGPGVIYIYQDEHTPIDPNEQYPIRTHRAYAVREGIDRRTKVEVDLPIELAVCPPWIWDGWKNLKIGETYQGMIGASSITDPTEKPTLSDEDLEACVDSNEGLQQGSGAPYDKDNQDSFQSRTAQPPIQTQPTTFMGSNVSMFDGSASAPLEGAEDLKLSAQDMQIIDTDRTIETSTDCLTRVYSLIRTGGLDVGSYIRQYTWRPIVTMAQMLGSPDLILDPVSGAPTQGTEGFHSRAFGDVADLAGLVNPKVKKILGMSTTAEHATMQRLDVRKRRRDIIIAYVDELTSSRGLLG
jgi:hypothetical protein